MRIALFVAIVYAAAVAVAQDPAAQVATPAPPANPIVMISVAPLAPADPDTPYASPRDTARHRLQSTLAELAAGRNLREGLRGFEQALLDDRTYAIAAFDLAVLAAISEKWDDAVAALEEAVKLNPALNATAGPQLQRWRMIAALQKTAEGRRRRAYDEALLPLVKKLPVMSVSEANAALIELGKVDPKRWEAPAMLASLNGDGAGYQASSKFLEIASANATDPAIKQALDDARKAAERELTYASARAAADAASDQGDYPKSAELYQSAWNGIPARVDSGMNAASAFLLSDDTQHASALLARLRDSKDPQASAMAGAMLKELAAIEPAAASSSSDAGQFFSKPGSKEPVRLVSMIPAIDVAPLETYARPLPKLLEDQEPVVLLSSLTDPPVSATMPVLPPPAVSGENPWREATAIVTLAPASAQSPRAVQTADLSNGSTEVRTLQVTSEPSGAHLFVGTATDASCETPCNLRVIAGEYAVRLSLARYREVQQTVQVSAEVQDLAIPLEMLRGTVILDNASLTSVKVNGVSVAAEITPVELSFSPGVYRVGADFGAGYRDRMLTIKAGARLRLGSLTKQ